MGNLDFLQGAIVSRFRLIAGGDLILWFATLEDAGNPRIWIECAWRLHKDGRIIVGAQDESESAVEQLQVLLHRTVERVSVADISGDLRIDFDEGIFIESFANATDVGVWELRRDDQTHFGVGPGFRRYEGKRGRDIDESSGAVGDPEC